MEDYHIYCCECERELDIDEVHYMADQAYCSDCLDEVTTLCYECGTRIYREHAVGGDDLCANVVMMITLRTAMNVVG